MILTLHKYATKLFILFILLSLTVLTAIGLPLSLSLSNIVISSIYKESFIYKGSSYLVYSAYLGYISIAFYINKSIFSSCVLISHYIAVGTIFNLIKATIVSYSDGFRRKLLPVYKYNAMIHFIFCINVKISAYFRNLPKSSRQMITLIGSLFSVLLVHLHYDPMLVVLAASSPVIISEPTVSDSRDKAFTDAQSVSKALGESTIASSIQTTNKGLIESSPISSYMTTTVQSSASSATFLAKGKKSIEEVLSTSSFIEDDIKTIISRISASAPDDIIVKLTSFISQLEASRSSNKIIPVKLNGPTDIKAILERQEKYITTYNLKANNLCPIIYLGLPTILCRLLNIKLGDNWNNKLHFTMPELIIAVLTGKNNESFPLIMKQEAIAYLTKYTAEIREFLAMAVLYMKTYKTVTFDRHRKKMYGLDNYFIPMAGSNVLKFSFSPGIVIDPQKASKAFYKVYIEYFHPGLLALTANIRAILSDDNLSFDGGSQTSVKTASIVYPYLDELLESTKITLWEPLAKKAFIRKVGEDNKTGSPRRNRLAADNVADQKLPPVEAKHKPYRDQGMPLPEKKPHKAPYEPKNDPRTAGTSRASSMNVNKHEFLFERDQSSKEELALKLASGFKSGGCKYYKTDSLYNQDGLRLVLDDYALIDGVEYCYVSENAYFTKGGKRHYPFRPIKNDK